MKSFPNHDGTFWWSKTYSSIYSQKNYSEKLGAGYITVIDNIDGTVVMHCLKFFTTLLTEVLQSHRFWSKLNEDSKTILTTPKSYETVGDEQSSYKVYFLFLWN